MKGTKEKGSLQGCPRWAVWLCSPLSSLPSFQFSAITVTSLPSSSASQLHPCHQRGDLLSLEVSSNFHMLEAQVVECLPGEPKSWI
jgi:hypothetical protein